MSTISLGRDVFPGVQRKDERYNWWYILMETAEISKMEEITKQSEIFQKDKII